MFFPLQGWDGLYLWLALLSGCNWGVWNQFLVHISTNECQQELLHKATDMSKSSSGPLTKALSIGQRVAWAKRIYPPRAHAPSLTVPCFRYQEAGSCCWCLQPLAWGVGKGYVYRGIDGARSCGLSWKNAHVLGLLQCRSEMNDGKGREWVRGKNTTYFTHPPYQVPAWSFMLLLSMSLAFWFTKM